MIDTKYIPSTVVHRKYKTYMVYRPKVVIATSEGVRSIVGDYETKNEGEAMIAARAMIVKMKEAK